MRNLLFIALFFASFSLSAQRRYDGKTTSFEQGPALENVVIAGFPFKEMKLKFPGSDTLQNGKIIFLESSIGAIRKARVALIIEKAVLVQFQVNIYTAEDTGLLIKMCDVVYGKVKKTSKTRSNEMFVWEHVAVSGKTIQTVLITGNKNRKAELVSWQL